MTRRLGIVLACFLSASNSLSSPRRATDYPTDSVHFFTNGRLHHAKIARELLAVEDGQQIERFTSQVSTPKALAQMKTRLLTVAEAKALSRGPTGQNDMAILGYPIWFGSSPATAAGILTNEIVLRTESVRALAQLRAMKGFQKVRSVDFGEHLYHAIFQSPILALNAANTVAIRGDVRFAHPNFMLPLQWRQSPSEPFYSDQWHLKNVGQRGGIPGADINAEAAWTITNGNRTTVIAVVDSGFETSHPDLKEVWHYNHQEIADNGVDDDSNGFVDDVLGWNFESDNNDVSDTVLKNHGTMVAGLLGAQHNGRGVIGVCPNCALIPILASTTVLDSAKGLAYAAMRGADIISNSWGYEIGAPETDIIVETLDEIAETGRDGKGTIILFAMNNWDLNDCDDNHLDISALNSVIAVSSSSDLDKKVAESGWGPCMEILAPTREVNRPRITTTDLTGPLGYNRGQDDELSDLAYTRRFGGTSAATPIAAGVFGLMLSVNPDLTRDEALALVASTADKIEPEKARYDSQTGFSKTHGYGRINAGQAVKAADTFRKYGRKRSRRSLRML